MAQDAAAASEFRRASPATPLNVARLLCPRAPVAQGIERCPAEAEVACSNHAGRMAQPSGVWRSDAAGCTSIRTSYSPPGQPGRTLTSPPHDAGLPEALSATEVEQIVREHEAGDSNTVAVFENDDAGYDGWRAANSDGFVLTLTPKHDWSRSRVHHSRCGTLSRSGTTRLGFAKACASRATALQVWARLKVRRTRSWMRDLPFLSRRGPRRARPLSRLGSSGLAR